MSHLTGNAQNSGQLSLGERGLFSEHALALVSPIADRTPGPKGQLIGESFLEGKEVNYLTPGPGPEKGRTWRPPENALGENTSFPSPSDLGRKDLLEAIKRTEAGLFSENQGTS